MMKLNDFLLTPCIWITKDHAGEYVWTKKPIYRELGEEWLGNMHASHKREDTQGISLPWDELKMGGIISIKLGVVVCTHSPKDFFHDKGRH